MKLYLTSLKPDGIPQLLDKPIKDTRTLFIPTAADPYEDKWFVENDIKALKELDFTFDEYDLKDKTPQQLENDFQDIDLVYVSGGNSFYLLHHMYQSGFDKVIKLKLTQEIVYAGASAGAAVMGASIELARDFDDTSKAPDLKTTDGIGLVPFSILPHYGNLKYQDKFHETINKHQTSPHPILTLTDNQALIVENNHYQMAHFE